MEELLGHYVFSHGDEDNSQVLCGECGRLIGPMEDCICWWPNDPKLSGVYYCKKCRDLSLGA